MCVALARGGVALARGGVELARGGVALAHGVGFAVRMPFWCQVAASTAAASGGAAAATAAPKEEGHGDSAKYIVIGVVLGVIFSTVALIVYIRFCCARDAKDDDECDDGYTSPERGRVPARPPATPMPSARPGAPSSAAASSTYAKKKKHSAQYGDTGVC